MNGYKVPVDTINYRTVIVEADSVEEAIRVAQKSMHPVDIVGIDKNDVELIFTDITTIIKVTYDR